MNSCTERLGGVRFTGAALCKLPGLLQTCYVLTWKLIPGRSCGSEPGMCSNPSAIIPVLDPVRGSLLVRGQKYRVVVDVDMPESPVNKQLGNASLRPGVWVCGSSTSVPRQLLSSNWSISSSSLTVLSLWKFVALLLSLLSFIFIFIYSC